MALRGGPGTATPVGAAAELPERDDHLVMATVGGIRQAVFAAEPKALAAQPQYGWQAPSAGSPHTASSLVERVLKPAAARRQVPACPLEQPQSAHTVPPIRDQLELQLPADAVEGFGGERQW